MNEQRKTTDTKIMQLYAFERKSGKRPVLVVVTGSILDIGKIIPIGRHSIIIGRDSKVDVKLNDEQISRRHLRISGLSSETGSFSIKIEDLGSTNGTFLNGQRIEQGNCGINESIQLGDTTLLFQLEQITKIKKQRHPLQMISKDPLTGIFNRRAFDQIHERIFKDSRKRDYCYCLMIIDIDHFKAINDLHGHPAGDEVLKLFCGKVANQIRYSDVFARLGGEEFAIILSRQTAREAFILAERIRLMVQAMNLDRVVDGLTLTISIGIAEGNSQLFSINAVYEAADQALREAKNAGRNRTVVYAVPAPN